MRRGHQGAALRTALSWLPVCAYNALIWTLSSRSLDVKLDNFPFRDKGVHFLEYGLLAFLMTHAVHVTWPHARRRLLAAFWLTVSLGLTDELHQAFVPGRNADGHDLVADALGAASAIALYAALHAFFRSRSMQARVAVEAHVPPPEQSIEAPAERPSQESL